MNFSVMRYICDRAVLQCGEENTVYGTAAPNETVTLTITDNKGNSAEFAAKAAEDGEWKMTVPAYPAGYSSYTFTFTCCDDTFTAEDILFGEVFHITGQSNMELPMYRTYAPFKPFEYELTPYIRAFRMNVETCFDGSMEEKEFRSGRWLCADDKEQLMIMSGTGYWFAHELISALDVPVGLLDTSSGGTAIESRFSAKMLKELGGYEELLKKFSDPDYQKNMTEGDLKAEGEWIAELDSRDCIEDKLASGADCYTEKCDIPFYFRDTEKLNGFCGRVWFRSTFEIPNDCDICDGELIFGVIIDSDKIYINGEKVGETAYLYPPRLYKVPAGLLRHGSNTIHISVDVKSGTGGFVSGKNYCLRLGNRVIDLSGSYEYSAIPSGQKEPSLSLTFLPSLPLSEYSTMTSPSFRINVKGILWYQGETNVGSHERYPELFKVYAEMYRSRTGKDLPIIFAQLPNFADPEIADAGLMTDWADLRLAQEKCLEVPGTAMTVNIDCGESNDLHPTDKKTVGTRLAWETLKLVYGKKTKDYSHCISAEYKDGSVILTFDGPDIVLSNETAKYFETVHESKRCKANAVRTSAHTITLTCGEKPDYVYYAYLNDPCGPDLFNTDKLPVSPFNIKVK